MRIKPVTADLGLVVKSCDYSATEEHMKSSILHKSMNNQ